MVKCTGRGLVVKRPGVLSKVQMLNLVLGVGVFSLLPSIDFLALRLGVVLSLPSFSGAAQRGPQFYFMFAVLRTFSYHAAE